ncbi:MAG TPA: methyltransferase domain-containing protein [Dehalococcoidia bacterium]|nr:methyltransferase domain-containing protein [Dehalococcoidia bacterium]
MSSPWDPDRYQRFKKERDQPFFDLLDMVNPIPGGVAADLGCGTGELTRVLHKAVGAASTLGIDSSETMLSRSTPFVGEGVRFQFGRVQDFAPSRPLDLIFSNAALQWLDDHESLFERLARSVGPGGQLAVQLPANSSHPSHALAFEMAREEPWRTELDGYVRDWPVLKPEKYSELLYSLSFTRQDVSLRVYPHELESSSAVVDWVRGTLLTDYQRRMNGDAFERFVESYSARLLPRLPDSKPYLYTYKRVLIWGARPGTEPA